MKFSNRTLLQARAVLATTRRAWFGHTGAGALVLALPMLGRAATRAESDARGEASAPEAAVDSSGQTAERLAPVLAKIVREHGRRNGCVRS